MVKKAEAKMNCEHEWRKVHEQAIFGGSFAVGWECRKCNKYIANSDLTPNGLPGKLLKQHRLVGAHGGGIATSSGKTCKSQIYDEETRQITYE
jgi:hypothetical protein